ncbi:MAG: hypothetical protein ACHBN1_11830 [Heteroscytonema crispum UTEX LB 1556]
MYKSNDVELFQFSLGKVIHILKLQNKTLVESHEKTITALLGSDYTANLFTAAILELSATDPDTLHWTFENFSTLHACTCLLEAVTRFAIQKLMKIGFVLGKDFSANSQGQILLNENAQTLLMESTSASDRLLLQKILLVPICPN